MAIGRIRFIGSLLMRAKLAAVAKTYNLRWLTRVALNGELNRKGHRNLRKVRREQFHHNASLAALCVLPLRFGPYCRLAAVY